MHRLVKESCASLFLFIAIIATIVQQSSQVDVRLKISPSDQELYEGTSVTVTCDLPGIHSSSNPNSIHLYCPLLSSWTPCFTTCNHPCSEDSCSLAVKRELDLIRCFKTPGTRAVSYIIPSLKHSHGGEYYCRFQGYESKRKTLIVKNLTQTTKMTTSIRPSSTIRHQEATKKLIPTIFISQVTAVHSTDEIITSKRKRTHSLSTMIGPSITVRSVVSPKPKPTAPESLDNLNIHEENYLIDDSTRNKAYCILGLLAIGVIMVALNVTFCIRCALVDHYSKLPRKRVRMGRCLCMEEEIYLRRTKTFGMFTPLQTRYPPNNTATAIPHLVRIANEEEAMLPKCTRSLQLPRLPQTPTHLAPGTQRANLQRPNSSEVTDNAATMYSSHPAGLYKLVPIPAAAVDSSRYT